MWQWIETFLVVSAREMLLASSWQRPGMLLYILLCTEYPPTTKNYSAQMSTMLRLTNPALTYQVYFSVLGQSLLVCVHFYIAVMIVYTFLFSLYFKHLNIAFNLREAGRGHACASTSRGRAEGQGERESQASCTPSVEPNEGFNPTTMRS